MNALLALPNGDRVAGGLINSAGGIPTRGVARWDGTKWLRMGLGIDGVVYALTLMANGDIIAGGYFSTAEGRPANAIARWNGGAWLSMGSDGTSGGGGVSGGVLALATLPNGALFAGGSLATWDGSGRGLAEWNPTTRVWQGTTGFVAGRVRALLPLSNGRLVVGGQFSTVGSVAANNIAVWYTSWTTLGTGTNAEVLALTEAGADVVATGKFSTAGGIAANRIARWSGSAWSPLGTGLDDDGNAVAQMKNGDVVAAGSFMNAGGVATNRIARWNGSTWSAMNTGVDGIVHALRSAPANVEGDLWVGGEFTNAGGSGSDYVARWNHTAWTTPSGNTNQRVKALMALPNGGFVAGGQFTVAGNTVARGIARFDGTAWSALDAGLSGTNPLNPAYAAALTTLPNGHIVAGGEFTTAGRVPANRIARWNGTAWSALGTGMDGQVMALATLANGDLVAGGGFSTAGGVAASFIARWNGTAWSALGTGMNHQVTALLRLPSGDLIAGGHFTSAGGVAANRIARFDGAAWSALGAGLPSSVYALTTQRNGDLVAAGSFGVARWNGASWSALGTAAGQVFALSTLPNDDLVAAGFFTTIGGVPANNIARFDGTAWTALGSGLGGGDPGVARLVEALISLPNGEVAAGGTFRNAGGVGVDYLARLTTSCFAQVTALPTPCVGPAGPLALVSTLPWAGATLQTTTTGFASNGFGLMVLGSAQTNTPLSVLHPAGLPGCSLLTNLDVTLPVSAVQGVGAWQIALPRDVQFAGATVFLQVLQFEVDAMMLQSISGSNGLQLVVGWF